MFAEIGTNSILIIALIALILIIVLWFVGTMNRLRRLGLKVQEAESGIDVALTKRFDLLTKLFATVTANTGEDTETLAKTIRWQNGVPVHASIKDKEEFCDQMETAARGIDAIIDRHPSLKADILFQELQVGVANTEEQLQAARRLYNVMAGAINTIIVTFPDSIIANAMRIEKKATFDAGASQR